MTWVDDVKSATDIATTATALGLTVRRRKFGPCPVCNDNDPRGSCGITGEGQVWICKCGAKGSTLHLVAAVLTGSTKPSDWAPVRDWCSAQGWCAGPRTTTWTPPPPRPPPPPLPYPEGIDAFLTLGGAVEDDPEVWAFWQSRGFRGHTRALWALPTRAMWPEWWGCGFASTWRLAAPMYDAAGVLRSVHARAVRPTEKGKTRCPKDRRGDRLLFADPELGLWLLRGESIPERVLVVEGITDYAATTSLRIPGVAVLGGISGSFAALADVRWPPRCCVYCATDPDKAGEMYAAEVKRAVPSAVRVTFGTGDVAEFVKGGGDVEGALR